MDLLSLDLVIVITIIIITDCSGMSYEGESTTQKSPTSTLLQMTNFLGTNVNISEIGTIPVWNTTDNSGPQRIKQKLSRLLKRKYRKNCIITKQQQLVECKELVLKIQEVMNSSGQAIMKLLDKEPKANGITSHVSGTHGNRTIKVAPTLQRVFKEECNFTSDTMSNICTWLLETITQMLMKEGITSASSNTNDTKELRQHLKMGLCLDPFNLKWYDRDELICCDGLFNRTSPHDECCSGNIVDNREQFCCDDHPFNNTDVNGCCGKKTYSDVDEMCCNDVLNPIDNNKTVCCGKKSYSDVDEMCCDEVLNPIDNNKTVCCGKKSYSDVDEICCDNVVNPIGRNQTACCGKKSYSDIDEICCDDALNTIGRNQTACCGKGTFNPDKELCCSDITMVKESDNSACCGSQMYNQQSQACCDGNVEPAFGDSNKKGDCCGSRNFESNCYSCHQEDDGNYTGIEKFNTSTHICCNARVKKRKGFLSKCCGVKIINADIYACINDTKILRHQTSKVPVNVTSAWKYSTVKVQADISFTTFRNVNDEVVDNDTTEQGYPLFIQIAISGSVLVVVGAVVLGVVYKFCGKKLFRLIGVKICGVTTDTNEDSCRYIKISISKEGYSNNIQNNESINSANNEECSQCPYNEQSRERCCYDNIKNNKTNSNENNVNKDAVSLTCSKSDQQSLLSFKISLKMSKSTPELESGIGTHISGPSCCKKMSNYTPELENDIESYISGSSSHMNGSVDEYFSSDRNMPTTVYHSANPSYYLKGTNGAYISSNNNILPKGNLFGDHFVDCSTQTVPKKETNQRTIFGEPFEHTCMLSETKATIELPDSVEKMTMPGTALSNGPVEVYCTSFSSLTQLHSKFNLSDDVTIASPAAEYLVTGLPTIPDYACVKKSFIGSPADLKVWKFRSDEGIHDTIDSIPVPEKTKTNEEQDMYYIIRGNVVYIYTKSFSGFYCTTCRHSRELKLKSFLFGSYKRFQRNCHEVRLMLYITDEVFKFPDYRKLMIEREKIGGRDLKTEEDVVLLAELNEEDRLMASVIVDGNIEQWIHKLHPIKQTPIKPINKDVALKDIAYKCEAPGGCSNCHLRVTDVPYSMEWYLTNAPDIIPEQTFKCVVDVNCIKKSSTDGVAGANGEDLGHENGATCIILDELHLRPEDRLPIEEREDTRAIHSLIDYFTHDVETEKQAKIIYELVIKHNLGGNSTVREVFTNLQKNLTCTGIYEAIVCVLQKNNFYVELDHLQSKNLIPLAFFRKPTQRVVAGGHDIAPRVYEHHQQASNYNSIAAQAAHTSAIVLNRSTPLNETLVLPSGYNGNTANVALPRQSNDNAYSTQTIRQSHDLRLAPNCSRQNNNETCGAMGGRSGSESQICRREMSSRRATSFSLNDPNAIETGDLGIPSNPHPEISHPHIESVQSNRVNVRAPSNVRPELSTTNIDSVQDRLLAMPRDYPTQENASLENTTIKEINSDTDSDLDV